MTEELLLSVETDFAVFSFVRMSRVFLLLYFSVLSATFQRRYERQGERLGCKPDARVNCCTRTGARIVISICVNEGCTLYHVVILSASCRFSILIACHLVRLMLFFNIYYISFEMISRFGINQC